MLLQHEAGVGVLLMDETGSVGLDLSFVSWVFLMEPLADASLQAQVTARAHRMGAAQAVHVETLIMKVTPYRNTCIFDAIR
jgi:SNF2 family DNA or RNA helicase